MNGLHLPLVSRDLLLTGLACLTLFALSIGTGPTSVCSVAFLVAWVLSGAWNLGRDWWLQQRDRLLPVLLVMLLPWLSLLWTMAPTFTLNPYLQRTHFWLLSFAVVCIGFTRMRIRCLAGALIAGVQVNVVLFITAKLGFLIPHPSLYKFMLEGRITFSLLVAVSVVLLSYAFKVSACPKTRILLFSLLMLDVVVLLSQSGRSGYLALACLAPLVAGNLFHRHRMLALAAVAVLFAAMAGSPVVRERIGAIDSDLKMLKSGSVNAVTETSAGARLLWWKGAATIFLERPLLGAGIHGYPVAMKRLHPEAANVFTNPHNYYLYVAASYGLLGIVLHGWLWWAVFRQAWPRRDSWSGFMVLSTLLVVSVGSFTESTPLLPQTGILLAMMVGLPLDRNGQQA